jgi:hypothetical protein
MKRLPFLRTRFFPGATPTAIQPQSAADQHWLNDIQRRRAARAARQNENHQHEGRPA